MKEKFTEENENVKRAEEMLFLNVAGIDFKNPVLVSSGTFGFGFEYSDYFDPSNLGGLVTKGITLTPRKGNPPPRLCETPAGLLNSIGLENPGVESFIEKYLPMIKKRFDTNIIVNIADNTPEKYAEIARKLDQEKNSIAALEINISCPNVKEGGMAFGSNPDIAYELVKAVKKETTLPVITKLSPNVTDPVEIAVAVEEAGSDVISLINTVQGMGIDIYNETPVLANVFGGLSGPAVKPIGVRMVWQVAEKVKVPLIGMGGIMDYTDALEYILAGASLVSIGTGNFTDPKTGVRIINDLINHVDQHECTSIVELIGRGRNSNSS